jgi:hypothetical protein
VIPEVFGSKVLKLEEIAEKPSRIVSALKNPEEAVFKRALESK